MKIILFEEEQWAIGRPYKELWGVFCKICSPSIDGHKGVGCLWAGVRVAVEFLCCLDEMAVVTSYSPKKGRKSLQKWRCLCIGNPDGKTLKNCWRLWSVRHGSSVDFFQLPFLLLRVLLKKSCNLLDVWTFPGWILGRGYNWKMRRKVRWVRRLRRRNRMTRSRWRCLWSSQADGFRY